MQQELPSTLKVVTIWLLIAAAVLLGVQWWLRESQRTKVEIRGEVVEIQRGRDGHYHWPGTVNGHAVDFLVDTGASGTAISTHLAQQLKLETLGSVQSQTAGGSAVGERVVADLALQGGIRIDRMRLIALPALGERPLLGMDVLGRLHWQQIDGVLRIDLRGRR